MMSIAKAINPNRHAFARREQFARLRFVARERAFCGEMSVIEGSFAFVDC